MTPSFDAATAEEAIAAFVSAGAPAEELLPLLPEQHPLYAGRSTNETTRIRGFILAAFERQGLPDDALPYVLEELQSGHDAYLVAAAARALRGRPADRGFVPFLEKAQQNIRYSDAPVTFETYKPHWPVANPTTAAEEIRKTLAWLQENADCCRVAFSPDRTPRKAELSIDFEDQDGRTVPFADFFRGKPTVVAFFYTRCDNPEKCSLTVARLARLQRALEGRDVRIAAVTYDPQYDLPSRMKGFGEVRGLRFTDDVRMLRTTSGFDRLRARFDLGVNFIGSLVNRHRIELYVLDARGNIAATFTRMQWDVEAVVAELERLPVRRWPVAVSALGAAALALLPKCPLCVGAYLSAFGLGGLQVIADRRWTIPLAIVLVLLNVWTVSRRSSKAGALSAMGAIILIASIAWSDIRIVGVLGALLMIAASMASAADPLRAAPTASRRATAARSARVLQ